MNPLKIKAGVSYHNGKEGIRSYSERSVIELNVTTHWNGGDITDGVRYDQTAGAHRGKRFVMPLLSFAKWAKGDVLPQASDSTALPSAAEAE